MLLFRMVYKFLDRFFPPDSIESYIEHKLPDNFGKNTKSVAHILSWLTTLLFLLLLYTMPVSVWVILIYFFMMEYVVRRIRERCVLAGLPERLISSNESMNGKLLIAYSVDLFRIPELYYSLIAEIANSFAKMRTSQMVILLFLIVAIPICVYLYMCGYITPLWQGILIYCVGLAISLLFLYPTVQMVFHVTELGESLKMKIMSLSGKPVKVFRYSGGRVVLGFFILFIFYLGFIVIRMNEPGLISLLMLMFCSITSLAPFDYRNRKNEDFAKIIQDSRDLIRVLNLEVGKNVFHDPDWFRGEEKFLLDCCSRYGIKPKAFQKLFREREEEVARILGATAT